MKPPSGKDVVDAAARGAKAESSDGEEVEARRGRLAAGERWGVSTGRTGGTEGAAAAGGRI